MTKEELFQLLETKTPTEAAGSTGTSSVSDFFIGATAPDTSTTSFWYNTDEGKLFVNLDGSYVEV